MSAGKVIQHKEVIELTQDWKLEGKRLVSLPDVHALKAWMWLVKHNEWEYLGDHTKPRLIFYNTMWLNHECIERKKNKFRDWRKINVRIYTVSGN